MSETTTERKRLDWKDDHLLQIFGEEVLRADTDRRTAARVTARLGLDKPMVPTNVASALNRKSVRDDLRRLFPQTNLEAIFRYRGYRD